MPVSFYPTSLCYACLPACCAYIVRVFLPPVHPRWMRACRSPPGKVGWLRCHALLLGANARMGRGFPGARRLFTLPEQYLIRPSAVDEDQASSYRSAYRFCVPRSDHSTTSLRSIPALPLLVDVELCGSCFSVAAYGVTPPLARPTTAHSLRSQHPMRMCMCSGIARLRTCGLFERYTPSRSV